MRRSNRLITVLIGMAALAVPFAMAPTLIQLVGWVFFWPYFVNYPPDSSAETWLAVISIAIPAVIYLAILVFAVVWVRKAPAD
jgi:hypothetical protein